MGSVLPWKRGLLLIVVISAPSELGKGLLITGGVNIRSSRLVGLSPGLLSTCHKLQVDSFFHLFSSYYSNIYENIKSHLSNIKYISVIPIIVSLLLTRIFILTYSYTAQELHPTTNENFNMAESITDLERLYNVDATFEYTPRNALVRDLDAFLHRAFLESRLLDHTVLITGFPSHVFDKESEDNPVILPRKRKAVYFPDSGILIFTMPGRPHDVVAEGLNFRIYDRLKRMNCDEELAMTGTATVELRGLKKEPDKSWGPQRVDYPTLILEVGVSESLRCLERDAQRWIENERSGVCQVITVKIYPRRHEIIFSVWRRNEDRKAVKDDDVHVEFREGQPKVRSNKSLRIYFEPIFKRLPTRGTAEKDLIISARELGSIARKAWIELNLIPRAQEAS